jgi:hypothetical protein
MLAQTNGTWSANVEVIAEKPESRLAFQDRAMVGRIALIRLVSFFVRCLRGVVPARALH